MFCTAGVPNSPLVWPLNCGSGNVTLTAERTIEAPNRAGVQGLYRSQAVFSVPQGSLDLATAKPLSGSYTEDEPVFQWKVEPYDSSIRKGAADAMAHAARKSTNDCPALDGSPPA